MPKSSLASDTAWADVCDPEGSIVVDYAPSCASLTKARSAPIDDYYTYTHKLMPLGDAGALAANDVLGRVLLLGIVSGVEHYFRAVLSSVLDFCPISRAAAADYVIPFGALDYYGVDELALGLLEGNSLASRSEIRSKTKKLLGVEMPEGGSIGAALNEFELVCALRHACVHSRGELSAGNARILRIPGSAGGRHLIHIKLSEFHAAAAACQNLVRAYNRYIYKSILKRWTDQALLRGDWSEDRTLFTPLIRTFVSKMDRPRIGRAFDIYRRYRPALLARATARLKKTTGST